MFINTKFRAGKHTTVKTKEVYMLIKRQFIFINLVIIIVGLFVDGKTINQRISEILTMFSKIQLNFTLNHTYKNSLGKGV